MRDRDWGDVGIRWHLRRPSGQVHSFTSLRQLDDLLELGPGEAVSFNRTSWTRLEEISDRSAWFSAHWARAERGEITSVPPGLDVRTDPDAVETEMFLFRPEE